MNNTVKVIPLSQGNTALVDDDEFEQLNRVKWSTLNTRNTDYAERGVGGKILLMHHVIMGTRPGMEIDHINGNGLDNRKENLRFVTHRQNMQNQHREKTSVFPGVFFDRRRGSWTSQIKINGKLKHIGSFPTEGIAFNFYRSFLDSIGEKLVGDDGHHQSPTNQKDVYT